MAGKNKVFPSPEEAEDSPALKRGVKFINDFEDLLVLVGGWGTYQCLLLVYFSVTCAFLSYTMYGPVLFLYTPAHWCSTRPLAESLNVSGISVENLTDWLVPVKEDGKREQCGIYNVTLEELRERAEGGGEGNFSGRPTVACPYGWEYPEDSFISITTEVRVSKVCRSLWGA